MTKLNYNVETPLSTFNRFAPLSDNPSSPMEAFPMVCSGKPFTIEIREEVVADKAASPMVCAGKSFTRNLPEDLVAEILSRIPIKTIARWNCVCKRWRRILSEPYFANLHLSRSPSGFIALQNNRKEYDIFSLAELDDKPDHHGIHHGPLTSFDSGLNTRNTHWSLCGSVNGLICLWKYDDAACVCNPITREYILLPDHKYISKDDTAPKYGFGFVKASNEYKVVCLYEPDIPSTEGLNKSWCKVYTLGTGMWRSLGHVPFLIDIGNSGRPFFWRGSDDGIFLSGNLHWLVYDQMATNHERVCTFDLKKEVFQLTACPQVGEEVYCRRLGILGECLCVCDTAQGSELAIWVMKDHGMKESWSKEIVIRDEFANLLHGPIHPLKVFKDGTMLLSSFWDLFTYDPGNKTFHELDIFWPKYFFSRPFAIVFVPSFMIRLKSFKLEKVSVF